MKRYTYPVHIPPARYVGTGVRPVFHKPVMPRPVREQPSSTMLFELTVAILLGCAAMAAVALWRVF